MTEQDSNHEPADINQRELDLESIKRNLSREGVLPLVTSLVEDFEGWQGFERALGMTASGLLFGYKWHATIGDPRNKEVMSYKAFAVDTTLPPIEIEADKATVELNSDDITALLDGGTEYFPNTRIESLSQGVPEEISDGHKRDVVAFYRKTGGFYIPQRRFPPFQAPTVGTKTLYPVSDFLTR